jgi:hypothetical protein
MYTDRRGNTSGQESHAEAKRKLKYKSLCIEIKLLWKMKCMITPVITRIEKQVQTNFEATPGKHSIYSLQKTAVLERIIR